jgi:hypothetical protein
VILWSCYDSKIMLKMLGWGQKLCCYVLCSQVVLDKEFTQECMVQFTPDVLVSFGQFFAMVSLNQEFLQQLGL